MDYRKEYERWIENAEDAEILAQLRSMDEASAEDAFYRDLAFGTGGLRGVLGAGTNRMFSAKPPPPSLRQTVSGSGCINASCLHPVSASRSVSFDAVPAS